MKSRPIIFNTENVQAIMAGNKTQTRRIVKPPYSDYNFVTKNMLKCEFDFHEDQSIGQYTTCPYGKPGDQLWVRETWKWEGDTSGQDLVPVGSFYYKADFEDGEGPIKWKPSIHMPRIASRITLKITNIRVEMLMEISEEDAKAEGVEPVYGSYIAGFSILWEEIHGLNSWDKNPWVWVINFKNISDEIKA